MDNNFTNPENNTQNTMGGNTYSYDYMNNTTTNDMNAAAQPTPADTYAGTTYTQEPTPVYTQEPTPAYTQPQPGTFTGETAAWQANNQAQQNAYNAQPNYNAQYTNQYGNPAGAYNAAPQKNNKGIAFAIISLVLGILGLLCCCLLGGWALILAIPGVVLGIISLVKKFAGKGMAIAGVICSGLAIVLSIVMIILSAIGLNALSEYSDYYDDYSYSSYYDYY